MNEIENRLISALQPVRGLFLAQVTEYAFRSGLFDQLNTENGALVTDLAKERGLSEERLRGLLRYLSAEGIVAGVESTPRLTARGRDLLDFRPWYELLVGGYGQTLADLERLMSSDTEYASRDGAMVGKGSCGISRHDAIPLVRRMIDESGHRAEILVDLGSGDGSFLLDLCETLDLPGIGFDPFAPSIHAAREHAARRGLDGRVQFHVGGIEESDAALRELNNPCFIAAFSLQEMLEQTGMEAVVSSVRATLAHPGSVLAVVEVDHRPSDPSVMQHGLGLAYYNPYYLMHQVTQQRLETRSFWEDLFAEAGAQVLCAATTDSAVDSTGLELGYLIRGIQ